MNLQQIEAICCIARHRYNISAAAEVLGCSQSGLSRRIKELEGELGAQVFVRTRNKVIGLTPQGERILRIGQRILQDVRALAQAADEGLPEEGGELRIATSHVHARYLLPLCVKAFMQRYPRVALTLQQCDPLQCRELVAAGEADLGVSTISARPGDAIVTLPVFLLPRCVVVPAKHALAREARLTLAMLAEHPLITNPATFVGRSILNDAFAREGLAPRVACSVTDADVCKTYVAIGMGIAVMATLAFDPKLDRGLVALDANHLFRPGVLNLVLRRHGRLTRPLQAFLELFAPHLARDAIAAALAGAPIDQDALTRAAPVAEPRAGA